MSCTLKKVKSFNAACNLFEKHFAKLGKEHKTVSEQLRAMIGLTRGFDSLLLMAITGKNRGQYNGKYGEKGMDGQNKVSEAWRGFLTEKGKSLSKEDWQMAVDFLYALLLCGFRYMYKMDTERFVRNFTAINHHNDY